MVTSHRREGWTIPQLGLAGVYVLLCPLIGFFAFVEIYQNVTHLVHPWFGDWAWIVPFSAEGMFTALYAGWVLLELRDDPPRRVGLILAAFLTACGLASYTLNVWTAHGIIPDALAHASVVTAFFGVLIFGKVLVRRLKVTAAERALESGMADARQHAVDLCRSVRGIFWRWRIPSLLRRQITSGRLCDEVRSAVEMQVSIGRTSGWNEAVRKWVFTELRIDLVAAAADQEAVREIARSSAPSEPVSVPEAAPEAVREARPAPRPEARSGPALRLAASKSRSMSAADLVSHVSAMLEEYGTVSQARVKRDLHVSTEKAAEALRLAKRERTVVPMSQRA